MKLRYKYDNGIEKDHSKFISQKTILAECEDAKQVAIYKIHTIYQTEEKEEYITTQGIR